MKYFLPALFVSALLSTPIAYAHELWLDPVQYQLQENDKINADVKVGQGFNGSIFSYLPQQFIRFDIANGSTIAPIEGRFGDRPAAQVDPLGDGLHVLIYQATTLSVFYKELDEFLSFVEHKDFADVAQRHRERGLPQQDFKEAYSRFAKSLVGVGSAKGEDRAFGLETEIIALENPYTDNVTDGLDIKVLYQDAPRAMAQIEVFDRSPIEGEDVVITKLKTNAEGVATIPVMAGHTYQLDAVVMREDLSPEAAELGAVWESLWANLTFAIPQ